MTESKTEDDSIVFPMSSFLEMFATCLVVSVLMTIDGCDLSSFHSAIRTVKRFLLYQAAACMIICYTIVCLALAYYLWSRRKRSKKSP